MNDRGSTSRADKFLDKYDQTQLAHPIMQAVNAASGEQLLDTRTLAAYERVPTLKEMRLNQYDTQDDLLKELQAATYLDNRRGF